jgi:hypothetical protein
MVWKLINVDSPGHSELYGGDDIKKIMKFLSGYDLKITDPTDDINIDTETSFSSEKLRIKSPTTGFNYIIRGQDIAADRIISLPLMTDDGEISLSASGAVNDWGAFMQTFRNQNIQFLNPANTFGYVLNTSAILDNRGITLPLLTADDTLVFANHTQTLANKTLTSPTITAMTIDTDTNTIKHSTTNNNNDLLMYKTSLGKYDRFERGAANQFIATNPTGTALEWRDISSISGGGGGGGTGDFVFPLANNTISGAWYGSHSVNGSGFWAGYLVDVSAGVTPERIQDATGRLGMRYNFTNDDDRGGFREGGHYLTRMNDPELWVRWRYDPLSATHTSSVSYRVVIGFTSDITADYGADGALANKSCFMWYKETAGSSIGVGRNDGDATQDVDTTAISLAQTNTSVNTIRIFGDNTNSRFGISLNGATAVYYTTEIPTATQRLGCIVQFENEGSDDRSFEILGAYVKAKVI